MKTAWFAALFAAAVGSSMPPPAAAATDALDVRADLPWLFPLNSPASAGGDEPSVDSSPRRLSNSRLQFTDAQLHDLFFVPDWHLQTHTAMPDIVLHGRQPDTFACGYCHLPGGQGRPENAALAGLPTAYIVRQVADIKSGARRSAWHEGTYLPVDLMRKVASHVTDGDVLAAAEYFSAQTLRPRVTVIERASIPRMTVAGWIYATDPRGGRERLGQRVIEWAPDSDRHERRDDEMRYIAFVPPGSVTRGRKIATMGLGDLVASCTSCHGEHLQGIGLIPPLAGRSPTYLLRQLVAFRNQDRTGISATPMQLETAKMTVSDMIAVAAFAAAQ
jgi:cytochrome c553